MELTVTLSPVEVDALQLAYPEQDLAASVHTLITPLVATTSEMRLQRLADSYRELSADDQLEAVTLLTQWRVGKEQAATAVREATGLNVGLTPAELDAALQERT